VSLVPFTISKDTPANGACVVDIAGCLTMLYQLYRLYSVIRGRVMKIGWFIRYLTMLAQLWMEEIIPWGAS